MTGRLPVCQITSSGCPCIRCMLGAPQQKLTAMKFYTRLAGVSTHGVPRILLAATALQRGSTCAAIASGRASRIRARRPPAAAVREARRG